MATPVSACRSDVPALNWAVGWPTLRAPVVPFVFDDTRLGNQLALTFRDGQADDPLANRIAEALWSLHTS